VLAPTMTLVRPLDGRATDLLISGVRELGSKPFEFTADPRIGIVATEHATRHGSYSATTTDNVSCVSRQI